jgi:hypothetical protein
MTDKPRAALCCYAHAGTYGNECGKPALFTRTRPSERTKSGVFYARRCADCVDLTGRENWGMSPSVPFDAAAHINEF